MNSYYNEYLDSCKEIEDLYEKFNGNFKEAKKLKGAIAANLLRDKANQFFQEKNLPIKASYVNSYVAGSKYEYDLIFVKGESQPKYNLIYNPDDVIGVIECKAGGLFDLEKDTTNIADALNAAYNLNNKITAGYITLWENIPRKDTSKNHWEETQQLLKEKVNSNISIYAVTLHTSNKIEVEGSDEEFYEFLESLIDA